MIKSLSAHNTLLKQIHSKDTGTLLFPGDYFSFGTPEAIHMAFSRMARNKELIRLGKGIYLKPKVDPELGLLQPSLEEIAAKIAEKEKVVIRPTGAYALNKLGLSTQVPTKVVFLTNGSDRKIHIGRGTITFKKTTPKKLAAQSDLIFLVIHALIELGETGATPKIIEQLIKILQKENPALLRSDAKSAPNHVARTLYLIADKIEKMTEFLQLPEDLRRRIIDQVNARTGMSIKAIEKDWWVTLVLKAVFSLPMSQHFIFKGGTSLSKAWKLIERFSEDIDIALSPEAFGRHYTSTPSHSYVKKLKKEGCIFTSTIIKDALQKELIRMGLPTNLVTIEAEEVNTLLPDKDPQTLSIRYPSLYDPNIYIKETVKVEFGVRSLKEPFSTVPIQSIIAEIFPSPSYSETSFPVTAVEPRKTFLEKLFLLHEKFITEKAETAIGERQSRHFSDLCRMSELGIIDQVINDPELYSVLLEHRRHYIRLKNVNYDRMQISDLRIIPPETAMEYFRQDYISMQSEMIYGQAPDFATLMDQLQQLNSRLSSWKNN